MINLILPLVPGKSVKRVTNTHLTDGKIGNVRVNV